MATGPELAGARPERGRLEALDGLRAIAATAIVVLHTSFYTARAQPPWSVSDGALQGLRLGVVLFFVLSGFLLFRPWAAAALGQRDAPDVRQYALRRAARLLPAYYLALAGSWLILAGTGSPHLPQARHLPLLALLLQNWTSAASGELDPPAWTLCVESSFYLVLPLIGALALRRCRDRRGLVTLCAAMVAASLSINALLTLLNAPDAMFRTMPATGYALALGMALAVAPRAPRRPAARTALLLTGAALVAADALAHVPAQAPGIGVWRDLPAAAGCALIVWACAGDSGALLASRPLRWLGERSYGLFLWHYPVILLLVTRGLMPRSLPLALALVLPLATAVAAASWSFVERPLLALTRGRARRGRYDGLPQRASAAA